MLEIILWIFFGVIAGTIAGLLPGIHPNLFVTVIIVLSTMFSVDPLGLAVFLASAGIVNSFVNYIPGIFLGAPEEETALSVLPGHRLLLQGRACEAIKLTAIGGLGSTFFCIAILPILYFSISPLYNFLKPIIQYILLFIVCYMIFTERGWKLIIFALLTFFLAGLLGIISLNYSGEMIFPLLSGLFGIPSLFLSIKEETKIPKNLTKIEMNIGRKNTFLGIVTGSVAGILVGLLPGVGPAQATVLAQETTHQKSREISDRQFLISNGCVGTANTIFSILALFLIGKGRSGLAVAIARLIEINFNSILIIISVIIISAGLGTIITMKLIEPFSKLISKVNYQLLCKIVILSIVILVFLITGCIGLVICLLGFFIGLIPNLTNIKKSHSMGCLLLTTLLFFFGI